MNLLQIGFINQARRKCPNNSNMIIVVGLMNAKLGLEVTKFVVILPDLLPYLEEKTTPNACKFLSLNPWKSI